MMVIRTASRSDLPALVNLEKLCNPVPWSTQQLEATLNLPEPIWVMENAQHSIVAMLVWQTLVDEAEIHLLNTHPHYRRRGYASKLLNHLGIIAQQQNMQRLLLEVRAGNTNAQQLYRQHGFTECAIRKHYYSDGEDAVLMEKIC